MFKFNIVEVIKLPGGICGVVMADWDCYHLIFVYENGDLVVTEHEITTAGAKRNASNRLIYNCAWSNILGSDSTVRRMFDLKERR